MVLPFYGLESVFPNRGKGCFGVVLGGFSSREIKNQVVPVVLVEVTDSDFVQGFRVDEGTVGTGLRMEDMCVSSVREGPNQ